MIAPVQANGADQVVLEVRDIHVGFDAFTVLDGMSFRVRRGEVRFLIGPNGAGKTTLLDIITGRTRPNAGSVHFTPRAGGKPAAPVNLVGRDEGEIARLGIGRKFQTPSVFGSLTVAENLELAACVRRGVSGLVGRTPSTVTARVEEILDEIGLQSRRAVLAATLAHGERQWLEIGMLLGQDADLLLLDEPVAGMTRAERDRTGELLHRIAQDRTVVVVEHDMAFLRQFGRDVTVLHMGTVLVEGPVAQVQADPRVIEVYLGRGSRHHGTPNKSASTGGAR